MRVAGKSKCCGKCGQEHRQPATRNWVSWYPNTQRFAGRVCSKQYSISPPHMINSFFKFDLQTWLVPTQKPWPDEVTPTGLCRSDLSELPNPVGPLWHFFRGSRGLNPEYMWLSWELKYTFPRQNKLWIAGLPYLVTQAGCSHCSHLNMTQTLDNWRWKNKSGCLSYRLPADTRSCTCDKYTHKQTHTHTHR